MILLLHQLTLLLSFVVTFIHNHSTTPFHSMPGMAPPVDFPPLNSSLPVTVDSNNNPFLNRPEDLNEHTWYLVHSGQIRDTDVGSWRQAGEPRHMPFPDLPIVCRKIVRAFHDRDDVETEWMMLQYETTTTNGAVSICRIAKGPMNPDAQVGGGPYTFQAAPSGTPPESDMFLEGDFLELLDLDISMFPRNNDV